MPGPNVKVRPGYIIYRVLIGNLPVPEAAKDVLLAEVDQPDAYPGEIVDRASSTQIYRVYKGMVLLYRREEKTSRAGQRPMSIQSFRRRMREARDAGLIEEVERGEVAYPGGLQAIGSEDGKTLLTIEQENQEWRVVESRPIMYALTEKGRMELELWGDLREAVEVSREEVNV